jgi:apolipoprotein N-acyltransferase
MTTEDIVEAPAARGPAAVTAGPPAPVAHAPGSPFPRPSALFAGLCALAGASAVLLYCCHFPVACGWLAWFGLVPLLLSWRCAARPRTVALTTLLGAIAFYLPVLSWVRVADPRMFYAWFVVVAFCAPFWPLAFWLTRILVRRLGAPFVFAVPAAWTAAELLRSHLFTGFSWYLLAYTQHDFLPVIQIADFAGAYGVSFLVAAVNALLCEALLSRAPARRLFAVPEEAPRPTRFGLLVQGLTVCVLLLGSLGYGAWRLTQSTGTPGPRVAVLQGDLDQRIRNQTSDADEAAREAAVDSVERHFVRLCDLAALSHPDLIVWPETSYPREWIDVDVGDAPVPKEWAEQRQGSADLARSVAKRWAGASVLLGLNSYVLQADRPHRYNSALLVGPDGRVAGRYDKIHRVPLGEYVPLRDELPFVNSLAPYDFDYSITAGRAPTRFPLKTATGAYTFGAVICYEDTMPDRARPYAAPHAADFVVNPSNDGWFNGSAEHEEHLAICRFRAVESRRTYARAVNMGVSAVIDSNGRVLRPEERPLPPLKPGADLGPGPRPHLWEVPDGAGELPTSEWHHFKKVSGVLLARLPIDDRTALYPRLGDWLPWGCWLLIGVAIVAPWLRRREVAHG